MLYINKLSFVFLVLCTIALAGCQTLTGSQPWTYNSGGSSNAAKAPPNDLNAATGAQHRNDEALYNMPAQPHPPRQEPEYQRPVLFADQSNAVQRYNQMPPPRVQAPIEAAPIEAEPIAPVRTNTNGAIKVALLLPLSGTHASLGQAMLNAAQLALFDIGEANFELLPRDTQGTPQGAEEAARDALQSGAQLILGPLFSSSVSAVRSVAGRANVNVVGFSTDWTQARSNVFMMGFLPFDQMERLMQYLAYAQAFERVGIFAPNSDYGRVVVSAYQKLALYFGLPEAEVTFFDEASTNLAPIIRDFSNYDEREAERERLELERFAGVTDEALRASLIEASTPIEVPLPYDAILMPVGGEVALSVSNLFSHFDMPPSKVRRLGTGLFDDEGLAQEQSMHGAWFAAPASAQRQSFVSSYKELYGSEPPRLSTLAYDATALAVVLARNGLNTRGNPDFSRSAIMNPNGFSGIDGIFRFRSNGLVERGLAVLEYGKRGRIKVLEEAPKTFQALKPKASGRMAGDRASARNY